MRSLFIFILISFGISLHAATLQEDAIQELTTIKSVFAATYAPADWKKQQFGWDLETEYQKAVQQVNSKADFNIKDFRRTALQFFNATKDYHVGVWFYSTEQATLPLNIFGADGRYFLTWIDRSKLPKTSFPLQVGDEVVEFAGRPVAEVIKEIQAENDNGVPTTDHALAQLLLTRRSGARGDVNVPSGPIEIKVKRGVGQQETFLTHQLIWDYTPEKVQIQSPLMVPTMLQDTSRLLKREMTWSGWSSYKRLLAEDDEDSDSDKASPNSNPFQIGSRITFVPALGTKIWETTEKNLFNAYIFRTEDNHLVGYVRMPHFGGGKARFDEFKSIIKKFEETTDALVIDQVNNPGGSVLYVYALVSLLNPQTSFAPKHHVSLTPADIAEAVKAMPQLEAAKTDQDIQKLISNGEAEYDGFPINMQFGQFTVNYFRYILSQWQLGYHVTEPTHLWGADRINTHAEGAYSKPILILVNELDFSGGDFFPAMLQDNGRAKVFGQRTAGAGGYVLSYSLPNRMGVEGFSTTGSLARRLVNNPIENLGVTPDIPYQLRPEDFTGGYKSYKAAVLSALSDMIQ